MAVPNVVHPTSFDIDGMLFQVVSKGPLSNEQAAKAATFFYRTRKFKKKDKGKLFQVVTLFDGNSADML